MKRFRTPRSVVAASALALAAAAACGSDKGGTTPGNNTTPAAIALTAGNDQIGNVGAALPAPIAARVTNAQGNPVSGKAVNFAVTRGLGTVASTTVTTDNNGVAQTTWTLGPGAVRQEARVTVASLSQTATATVDTTHALFINALKDTVAVGDTIWLYSFAGTTSLNGETRGAVMESITTGPSSAVEVVSVVYLQGEYIDLAQPSTATISFVTSGPKNTNPRQNYLRTAYIAKQFGAGKDVQFAHGATSFLGARTFNDLLNRVNVVGTSVHIR